MMNHTKSISPVETHCPTCGRMYNDIAEKLIRDRIDGDYAREAMLEYHTPRIRKTERKFNRNCHTDYFTQKVVA